MCKSIKGKECGKGIFQRKDGWYIARFVDKSGIGHRFSVKKVYTETPGYQKTLINKGFFEGE